MNVVNLGDPFTRRITLRLTEDQFLFLLDVSSRFGLSPSEYLRKLLDSKFFGGYVNENVKADVNDKL